MPEDGDAVPEDGGKGKANVPKDKRYSELADKYVSGEVTPPSELDNEIWLFKELSKLEEGLKVKITDIVEKEDLWTKYLSNIYGVGPLLAASLISFLHPIDRFKNVSKLHAYAGLSAVHWESECARGHKMITTSEPARCKVKAMNEKTGKFEVCAKEIVKSVYVPSPPKRKEGHVLMVNSKLHVTLWKLSDSFLKQRSDRSVYRRYYDQFRLDEKNKNEAAEKKLRDAVLHRRAMRKVQKMFLQHLLIVWGEGIGMTFPDPYPVQFLGRAYEKPPMDRKGVLPSVITPPKAPERLHFLVDSFYDVQQRRIETYNRIVAWIYTNRDRVLPEAIPQP